MNLFFESGAGVNQQASTRSGIWEEQSAEIRRKSNGEAES
jgi:hypothetical protein